MNLTQECKLTNNLRAIRRGTADLTQQQLADLVGCTRQTIAALEREKYSPSLVLAFKIAIILGVKVDELFNFAIPED